MIAGGRSRNIGGRSRIIGGRSRNMGGRSRIIGCRSWNIGGLEKRPVGDQKARQEEKEQHVATESDPLYSVMCE